MLADECLLPRKKRDAALLKVGDPSRHGARQSSRGATVVGVGTGEGCGARVQGPGEVVVDARVMGSRGPEA